MHEPEPLSVYTVWGRALWETPLWEGPLGVHHGSRGHLRAEYLLRFHEAHEIHLPAELLRWVQSSLYSSHRVFILQTSSLFSQIYCRLLVVHVLSLVTYLGMTIPILTVIRTDENHSVLSSDVTVAYYLPTEYQAQPPQPSDTEISIEEWPATTVYTRLAIMLYCLIHFMTIQYGSSFVNINL
jgi:hypothetical protein